ncbi:protein kinase domain-containing protein [Filimonas effusa]|uniref:Protein kinase domain-containing protein n=1 Tax=Filimonas effusa TaxID=2508721 RepID=A0A4Q1DEF5_9BACT|nr:protein kinase [Filimonas effusa]RXK87295.1 hypothetical protein ESB13_11105 [Filimonas effusa]
MQAMLYKGVRGSYTAGRVLGKGGEGIVYAITESDDQVLKIYNEAVPEQKVHKLAFMASINDLQLQSYAAWPIDIVSDSGGSVCGFVMRKLTGYVPMHMLFSPLDRKKLFPDKGYNFLVHVARNLAMAFTQLHAKGIVIGDVNEGNLLVNERGMVGMIDCDSFQMKEGERLYYCEVGVPRYTAPELYDTGSFATTVRTESSDSFAMAILIFQLLMLGRHPFAGKNLSSEDISEEKAIRSYMFAYSLKRDVGNYLAPPPDTLPVTMLGEVLVSYFHQSFESRDRVAVKQWAAALEQLLVSMKRCARSKVHSYPSVLSECPWCEIKDKRNILYFLDEQVLQADWSKDIDHFVNGIKVEKLSFPPLHPPPAITVEANPIDERYRHYNTYQHVTTALLVLVTAIVAISYSMSFVLALFLVRLIYLVLPWKKTLKEEGDRYLDRVGTAKSALESALREYYSPVYASSYSNACTRLKDLIEKYKRLSAVMLYEKQQVEERLYNLQLDVFLRQFLLEDHTIPGIAAKRKEALYRANIYSAADIKILQTQSIQGIGAKYTQELLLWCRQVSADFVYKPDASLLKQEQDKVQAEFDNNKKSLGVEIKGSYSQVLQFKANINARQKQLVAEIDTLYTAVAQAEADLDAFNELVG